MDIAASGVRKRTIVKNGQVVGVETVKKPEPVGFTGFSSTIPVGWNGNQFTIIASGTTSSIFNGTPLYYDSWFQPTPKDSMRDAIENARKLHPDVFEGK